MSLTHLPRRALRRLIQTWASLRKIFWKSECPLDLDYTNLPHQELSRGLPSLTASRAGPNERHPDQNSPMQPQEPLTSWRKRGLPLLPPYPVASQPLLHLTPTQLETAFQVLMEAWETGQPLNPPASLPDLQSEEWEKVAILLGHLQDQQMRSSIH